MKYVPRQDPFTQVIDPKKTFLAIACCDCGLVHRVDIERVGKKHLISLTFIRDQRSTGQHRRQNAIRKQNER